MIVDPNVEQVRKVREALIKRYGGLSGWIRHLQAADAAAARAGKPGKTNGAAKRKPTRRKQKPRSRR